MNSDLPRQVGGKEEESDSRHATELTRFKRLMTRLIGVSHDELLAAEQGNERTNRPAEVAAER